MDEKKTKSGEVKSAEERNKMKLFYCTKCCQTFKMDVASVWRSKRDKNKIAELITGKNHQFLLCTCGEVLAFVAQKDAIAGELVGAEN